VRLPFIEALVVCSALGLEINLARPSKKVPSAFPAGQSLVIAIPLLR
jgi:hypothetical protein